MSTSQSFRSREFGADMNRIKVSGNKMRMAENDVFLTTGNAPLGKGSELRVASALTDSSNNLGRNFSSKSEFSFKKPITLSTNNKLTKSVSDEDPKLKSDTKLRTYSVPSFPTNKCEKISSLKEFRDCDDWYPEPEFLRDITSHDLKEFSHSPIEIDIEELPAFIQHEDNAERDGVIDEIIESEDEYDEENYPEIEKLPVGYATQMWFDNPADLMGYSSTEIYTRDDPTISDPSEFDYKLSSSFPGDGFFSPPPSC